MSLPMAYYTSDATAHCLFPAETAFSARRNRLFRASEKHISYGGRACFAAWERLFRIPEQSLSDDCKGKPVDCQHDRQTAKRPSIYSRKTVRAQILPYFRITMNIYSHSAQRFCIFMRFVFRPALCILPSRMQPALTSPEHENTVAGCPPARTVHLFSHAKQRRMRFFL